MNERKKTLYVSDLCIDILLSSYNPIARLLKYKYIIVNGAMHNKIIVFFLAKKKRGDTNRHICAKNLAGKIPYFILKYMDTALVSCK